MVVKKGKPEVLQFSSQQLSRFGKGRIAFAEYMRRAGFTAGQEWAGEMAEYGHLARLAADESPCTSADGVLACMGRLGMSAHAFWYDEVDGADDSERLSPFYWLGFRSGAVAFLRSLDKALDKAAAGE